LIEIQAARMTNGPEIARNLISAAFARGTRPAAGRKDRPRTGRIQPEEKLRKRLLRRRVEHGSFPARARILMVLALPPNQRARRQPALQPRASS